MADQQSITPSDGPTASAETATVRLPKDLLHQAAIVAEVEGVSTSAVVLSAIDRADVERRYRDAVRALIARVDLGEAGA